MEFLSGVLFAASFFGIGYCCYKLGQKSKRPAISTVPTVDEESQRKAERLHRGFEQMMTYDVHTALKGKKVSE